MTYQAQISFPSDATAPGRARAWTLLRIREALGDTAAAMLLDDVALVVSELMTNAVRGAGKKIKLSLLIESDQVRVAVLDLAPRRARGLVANLGDDAERSMQIVSRLTNRWGERALGAGKEIWAELSLIQARAM